MSLIKYFISKLPFIIINFFIFIFSSIIMGVSNSSIELILIVAFIWFVPIFIYFILDFICKKRFFDELVEVSDKLDKKYLLPEVIKRPRYYEGQIIYDILAECNRDMHEHVYEY